MKRPGVVWVFTILVVIGILWSLGEFIFSLTNLQRSQFSTVTLTFSIIMFALLIPRAIMIYYFFMLKRKALKWTHISFGSALGVSIVQILVMAILLGGLLGAIVGFASIFSIAIIIFFWWVISDYIKKKQIDGKPVFT